MNKNIDLIKSTVLTKFLSDEDILTNLESGKFKVSLTPLCLPGFCADW